MNNVWRFAIWAWRINHGLLCLFLFWQLLSSISKSENKCTSPWYVMFIASAWLKFAILKKGLLFDKINIETAILLLLYLTYKELRLIRLDIFILIVYFIRYTLPIRNWDAADAPAEPDATLRGLASLYLTYKELRLASALYAICGTFWRFENVLPYL